jgi:hypothetical protein
MISEVLTQLVVDLSEGYAITGVDSYVSGVKVVEAWPDKMPPPPMVMVTPPNGTWIFGGQFDDYVVNVDLDLRTAKSLTELTNMVETALAMTTDYGLLGVTAPSSTGGVFGCTIHLSVLAKL